MYVRMDVRAGLKLTYERRVVECKSLAIGMARLLVLPSLPFMYLRSSIDDWAWILTIFLPLLQWFSIKSSRALSGVVT